MKLLTFAVLIACVMTGCVKEETNTADTGLNIEQEDTAVVGQTEQTRVLAASGMADEEGFYSIDLPRNANDLIYLDSINSRLAWVSAVMVKEGVKEFEKAEGNLLWNTLAFETAFNYGSTMPFVEGSDGRYTTISRQDFVSFAKSCFEIADEGILSIFPDGFAADNDMVKVEYKDPGSEIFGFVITDYKQEGLRWYIKGELMGENGVFAKGTFILEKNEDKEVVPFKIISFVNEE